MGFEIATQLGETGLANVIKLFSEIKADAIIGKYLALENIGILFEPELMLDLRSLIESSSINKCLFIKSDGVIENDCYYPFPATTNYKVNLKGLSFVVINP